MLNDDRELHPVTYSIKSYRARNAASFKQIIKVALIAAVIIFALFITALTLFDMA